VATMGQVSGERIPGILFPKRSLRTRAKLLAMPVLLIVFQLSVCGHGMPAYEVHVHAIDEVLRYLHATATYCLTEQIPK